MSEVESKPAAQPPQEVRATSGGALRALRRSTLPFFGGLVMVVAFILVTSLLVMGVIRFVMRVSFEGTDDPHARLTAVMVVVALVAVVVAFLFAAGLVDLLVQSALHGKRGSIGSVLSAFRCVHWLLLTAVIVAPLVALIAFTAISVGLAAPLVVAFGEVVLVYCLYTVPLILDRRLNTFHAIAESARLVRLGGFVRQYVPLVLATYTLVAFWWMAAHRIGSIGQYWEPSLGDAASWLISDSDFGSGLDRPTVLVPLVGALAVAVSCGALSLLLAGMYASVWRRRDALEADGTPQSAAQAAASAGVRVAPLTARRRWPLPASVAMATLLLMATATAFVWWYGTPLPERELKAGERTTLRSDLTLTVPAGQTAWISRARRYPSWLGLGDNGGLAVPTFFGSLADIVARDMGALIVASFSPEDDPSGDLWLLSNPVVGSSANGTVEMRWKSGSRYAYVFTHIPGGLDGMVKLRVTSSWKDHRPVGPAQALQALAGVWSAWSIQGAQLPAQTAWRSRRVAPGHRTTLSSGLSVVMPHRWAAELASSSRGDMPAQSFMPLRLDPRGLWYGEVLSLRSESDARLTSAVSAGNSMRRIRRSADGMVEIYGSIDAGTPGSVVVVTRLPGRPVGLMRGVFATSQDGLSKAEAWRCAVRMWKAYQVEGAKLPALGPS
jgi:hypothetical protein